MRIYYGLQNNAIDVTKICLENLTNKNIITIPCGDLNRSSFFTDPMPGIHKKIIIENNGCVTEYDEFMRIKINILDNTLNVTDQRDINNKLINIHTKLKINYGTFYDEIPEQKMAVRYLTGNEKVLEIGANIGRNSLVIASILNDQSNFVTLESHPDIAKQLTENRDLNSYYFHIEDSALSNRKLMQKEWQTKHSDALEDGYTWVNTITLDTLKSKYNIVFDTLVLDCEGSFYYILMDMPEILNNINLIIMENDYWDISHKNYIDEILVKNSFYRDYKESGGWGPCYENFFEVWKRD